MPHGADLHMVAVDRIEDVIPRLRQEETAHLERREGVRHAEEDAAFQLLERVLFSEQRRRCGSVLSPPPIIRDGGRR